MSDDCSQNFARRTLLGSAGLGFGRIALASLLAERGALAAGTAPAANLPAVALPAALARTFGRAKSVIFLQMSGAPSQLDMFDYKPKLQQYTGKPCPKEFVEGKRFAFIQGVPNLLGTSFKFGRYGQSGAELSELLPQFRKVVDDVAIIKTLTTDEFNHVPGQLVQMTGTSRFGGGSIGSWVTYGLGTENKNLPGYVVMLTAAKSPDGGKSLWGSGVLPSVYQGVQVRNTGDPVLYLANPPGLDRAGRRETLDALTALNRAQAAVQGDPEIETRLSQYELAYRMQASVPDVMDISREPQHVLDLYGAKPGWRSPTEDADDPRTMYKGNDPTFANSCLLARRLVERGVRFVQIFDWGWDHHGIMAGESIDQTLPIKCQQIDRAMTGLILDLKQRGLLDQTLIVWGGEFGRTPMQQNSQTQQYLGRDHHPFAFTMWAAGGGIKGGQTYGTTDDMGYYPATKPLHVRDLHATMLHLAGLDPYRFSYAYQGLDQRLIGPDGKARIIDGILA